MKKKTNTITKLKQNLKKKYSFISEEEKLIIETFLKDLPKNPKERNDYLIAGLESLSD